MQNYIVRIKTKLKRSRVGNSSKIDARREKGGGTRPNYSIASEGSTTAARLREDVPKSQCFIPSSSYNRRPIGTHRQVEHSVSVTSQSRYLLHCRILPYDHLIQRVSMGADKFVVCLREHEVADLGSSVDCAQWLQGLRIPKPDVLICRSASRC